LKRIRRISGQIAWRARKVGNLRQDCWKGLLADIGKLAVFRGTKGGYYRFSGGRLYLIGNPIDNDGYTTFTVGFKGSKPSFVDLLLQASTGDFEICDISFFLRDQMIDFENLLKNLRIRCNDLREEANGNFSAKIADDLKVARLSAYPNMNIIKISRSFTRRGLEPSRFLDRFIEMNLNGK